MSRSTTSRGQPIYEGKAKILYEGTEPGTLIQYFKDDATAFNNKKQGKIAGKGVLNNRISEYIMIRLEEMCVPTHFIKSLNMREQLIKAADIIPVEVVVRNLTAGSLSERFGVEEGMLLPHPIIEWYLKSDKLNDPMISEDHIMTFQLMWPDELEEVRALTLRINDILGGLFTGIGIKLVDMKLEFGRIYDEEDNGYIILADEISPDSCRLWDMENGEKLDKDRFRRDLGGVEDAYQEVAKRLGVLIDQEESMNNVTQLKAGKTKIPTNNQKKDSAAKKPTKPKKPKK